MSPRVGGVEFDSSAHPGEDPLLRAAKAYGALDERLKRVEATLGAIPQLQRDVATLNELLADAKAVLRGALSKGILLIVSAVGGTYGVTKATETKAEPTTTVIQRSAFDRALDACRQLPTSDAQGECVVRVIREQMPAPR